MFAYGEPVTVSRGGSTAGSLVCGYDPLERRLYAPFNADVRAGDLVGFRGLVRRVASTPERWLNPFTGWQAGQVIHVEDGPLYLPDLGQLLRPTGETTLDEVTGAIVPVNPTPLWSGLCSAEPQQSAGQNPDVGLQRLGIVPFLITVPLDVVDVKPGDLFKVTQSRDARLVARTMTVTGVRASSTALVREVLAFDSQD